MKLNPAKAKQFFLAMKNQGLDPKTVEKSLAMLGYNFQDVFELLPATPGALAYIYSRQPHLKVSPKAMGRIIDFSTPKELRDCLESYYYYSVVRRQEQFTFANAHIALIIEKIKKFDAPRANDYYYFGNNSFLNYYISEYKALKKLPNLLLSEAQLMKVIKSSPMSYLVNRDQPEGEAMNVLQTYFDSSPQCIVPLSDEMMEYIIKKMPHIDEKISSYTLSIMSSGCTSLFKVLDKIEELTGHSWRREGTLLNFAIDAHPQSVEYLIRNNIIDTKSDNFKKVINARHDDEHFAAYIEKHEIKTEKKELAKTLIKLTPSKNKEKIATKINKI